MKRDPLLGLEILISRLNANATWLGCRDPPTTMNRALRMRLIWL